jgi:natural resistance-associated macrophage protein
MRGVLRYLRIETPVVLLGAFLINLTVICVFAQGFYGTDQEIGLQAAGDLLAERFGQQFKVFWAVGLLAAGQVSTIALTYAGQLVMSGLLQLQVKGWARMIGTRLFALAPALTVAIVSNANNKFDGLNQMLNIVQSIQLPFALIPAIHMAGSAAVMGPPGAFATRRWLHLFCSLVALTVVSINCFFLVTFRRDNLPAGAGVSVGWGFLMAAYYLALAYFALGPDKLAARFGPYLRRMRSGANTAAIAAGSAAGVAVEWVKGINWVSVLSCCGSVVWSCCHELLICLPLASCMCTPAHPRPARLLMPVQ